MSHDINKPAKVLQFLNKKGQGIVEFALVLAFCAGIGLAAREAGLAEALDAAFAGTGGVAAPKDIQPGVSKGSEGSSTTVIVDQSNKVPERTDAKYASMTSDETKDLNFINDLKDYFTAHPTENDVNDEIWSAYKGNQTFANAEAETKARSAALALLGSNFTGDNAVDDAVWKDLKEANNWAFDTDDLAIYNFLTTNNTLTADELQLRNVYFSELDETAIATIRSNSNSNHFDNENIYSSYLAIKKKFWPNPVNLTLAPVISNPAFNASSFEQRIFNYVKGVSGQTGLIGYFESFSDRIPNPADRLSKDLSVFKLGNEFAADGDNDELTVAMFSAANNGITAVDDNFWKQIKQNKGWALDTDDETIKAKLTEFIETIRNEHENETLTDDEIITELKERNTQFNKLDNSSIANMISNLESNNLNEGAYVGYLAIKKQFWPDNVNSAQIVLQSQSGGGGSSVDFATRKGEVKAWIISSATTIVDNSHNNSLQRGDIIKSGDNYYITLATNTNYDFRYGNSVQIQATWGNFAELTNRYYGAGNVNSEGNLPTLYAGDIVINSDGKAYVYMDKNNPGYNYAYPLDTSVSNLFMLNE